MLSYTKLSTYISYDNTVWKKLLLLFLPQLNSKSETMIYFRFQCLRILEYYIKPMVKMDLSRSNVSSHKGMFNYVLFLVDAFARIPALMRCGMEGVSL